MIRLEVEEYCHDCEWFESTEDKTMLYAGNDCCGCEITVQCKNKIICKKIAERMSAPPGQKNEKTPGGQ